MNPNPRLSEKRRRDVSPWSGVYSLVDLDFAKCFSDCQEEVGDGEFKSSLWGAIMKKWNQGGNLEQTLESVRRALDQGLLPGRIFSDSAIFELEVERLFARAWLFVGHESELPNPGDYVLRKLVRDSVIFVRGRDGEIRVLLNACRHRGMMVCRTERGNAASFRCPYHGWVYSNMGDLLGVPALKEGYGDRLDRAEWGLIPVPKVAQYNGMVFASLSANAPPLEDYLGEMKWYLDIVTGRSDAGLEVIGAPRRWEINANWKWPADNFVGDSYHTAFVHDAIAEVGLLPKKSDVPMWSSSVSLANGHGVWLNGAEPGNSLLTLRSYPECLVESLKRNLLPGQVEILERAPYFGGNVFPNLGYMDVAESSDLGGASVGRLSFRVWQPIAVDRTEICSWFLVERDAPKEFKEASYHVYMRNFGPAGSFEQDDMEVWCRATQTAKGILGGNLLQNVSLGMDHHESDPTFPGPGKAIAGIFCESNQRAFYRTWLQYLNGEV
jgi:nitrite reductase/ring-hydroxylating ferredoxin subunit